MSLHRGVTPEFSRHLEASSAAAAMRGYAPRPALLALAGLLTLAFVRSLLGFATLFAVTPCEQMLELCGQVSEPDARRLLELVAEATQAGASGVNCADKRGLTPLMYASIIGPLGALVPLLVRAGAQVSLRCASGNTALHLASSGGNIEAARALLSARADLATMNGEGATPLAVACQRGHAEVAQLFVSWSGRGDAGWLDAADKHGMTALLWACESGGAAKTALMLVEGGAKLDHVIYNAASAGRTALDFALARVGKRERDGSSADVASAAISDSSGHVGFAEVVAAIRARGGHTMAELMAIDRLARGCTVVGVMSEKSAAADPRNATGLLRTIEEIYDRGRPQRSRDAIAVLQKPSAAAGAGGRCPLGSYEAQHAAAAKWHGRPFDETRAAAEDGDLAAQFVLAERFKLGSQGAPADDRLALHWARLAVAGNMASAQVALAAWRKRGVAGLPPDPAEATRLFALGIVQVEAAAERGHEPAVLLLQKLAEDGVPEAIVAARRLGFKLFSASGEPVEGISDRKSGSPGEQLLEACKWQMVGEAAQLIGNSSARKQPPLIGEGSAAHEQQQPHQQQQLIQDSGSTNIEFFDYEGFTPLIAASFHNLDSIVALLIAAGAKLDTVEVTGNSALTTACAEGSAASAELLVEAGAALNLVNAGKKTALDYVLARGRREPVWAGLEAAMRARGGCTFAELTAQLKLPAPPLAADVLAAPTLAADVQLEPERITAVTVDSHEGPSMDATDDFSCGDQFVSAFPGVKMIFPYKNSNTIAIDGSTDLIRAACLNNLPRVLQLIQLGAELDLVDAGMGYSALHWASIQGHEHVVKALLDGKDEGRGATVDLSGKLGWTPLMSASIRGHEAVVRLLLLYGAKQTLQTTYGATALHDAVIGDQPGVLAMLLAAPGAAAVLTLKTSGLTPLAYAIEYGRAECEAVLRADGAPERGLPAPTLAADEQPEPGRIIAAVVNSRARPGKDVTANSSRGDERKQFVFSSASGETWTIEGSTELIRAACLNNLPRVLQLIQLGAELDLVDETWGRSALYWASGEGHENVAKALLDGKDEGHGAMVNLRNERDWTPLMRASDRGHEAVVRLLLLRGAEQELQDRDGFTALHWAVFGDRPGVVALLCAAPGAAAALALKLNAAHGSRTPLAYAIHRGHAECEVMLRAYGALG